LKFAQKKTIDEIKIVPKVGFAKLVRDFTGVFNYNTWAWISVGLSVLFLASFLLYYFTQTSFVKRLFFVGMFLVLLGIIITYIAAMFEKNQFDTEKPAILFAEIISVKSEPKNTSETLFVLHEGTKVYVLESVDSWKKVQLTDGSEGWIEENTMKLIK
jgi:chromate transport protein ChrA